jgi:hypothetical protein
MRKVVPLIACCLALSACATPGGVEVAGAAAQVTPPPSTPPPPSNVTPSVDPVAILRADPKVSANIKTTLTPCLLDRYPVDSRYVDVTQDGAPELVVTVVSCDEKTLADYDYRYNLAGYVYSLKATPPVQLLAVEEPGADIVEQPDFGLLVSHVRYQARDKSCCPSGSFAVLYRWTGTAFEQLKK